VPVTPLIRNMAPAMRTSAFAVSVSASRLGASNVNSTGTLRRAAASPGSAAWRSSLSACAPLRAVAFTVNCRSAPMAAVALIASTRSSTLSRGLANTSAPSLMVMRSIRICAASDAEVGAASLFADAVFVAVRSRSNGR